MFLDAVVVDVIDGDTIKVRIGDRVDTVRLIGMDAPETGAGRGVVECMSRESTAFARDLLQNQHVRLEVDPTQDERDRYDRLLAYVWRDDDVLVNRELIAQGFAHEYTYDLPYRFRDVFRDAEAEARDAERGIWAPGVCPQSGPAAVGGGPPMPLPFLQAAPTTESPGGESAPGAATGGVVIADVFYDGDVQTVESDEYAVILNTSDHAVNLEGWRLNAGYPGQDFVFPAYELAPGQSCRIYTNQTPSGEPCVFSFRSEKAIWNNKGDTGYLYDATGREVSRFRYP